MSVIVADGQQRTDGAAFDFLSQLNVKLPIVLVTRIDGFEFNPDLLSLKDYVLADFMEMGWDWRSDHTPLFGKNARYYAEFQSDEWQKFDDWVSQNPPKYYLKRELLKKDQSDAVLPIEYPCRWSSEPQSKEEFEARPITVFFNWGMSNPCRPRLQGEIWRRSQDFRFSVCDSLYHLDSFIREEKAPRWLTVNTPHYARLPMDQVLHVNGMAKLSVSLPGAGVKCFRHTEASLNSVMVMQEDELAWTHEWIDGVNCLKMNGSADPVSHLVRFLKRKDLYSIYRNGVETCEKYRMDQYSVTIENIINGEGV